MKRIYKIVRLLPLWALFLSGCNKNSEEIISTSDIPVTLKVAPISLWGENQHSDRTSRASTGPLNSWYNTPVHIAYGESAGAFSGYGLALNGNVHNNLTTFSPQLFYPSSNAIFMKGFYPRSEGLLPVYPDYQGKQGDAIVSNTITYTIDGSYDIMVSNQVSGSGVSTISAGMFYNHLLTRISFLMYSDGTFPSSAKIKKIVLNDVKTEVSLNLAMADYVPPPSMANYPLTFLSGAATKIEKILPGTGYVVSTVSGGTEPAPVGDIMFEPGGENGVASIDDFISIFIDMTDVDELPPTERVEREYKITGLSFADATTLPGYYYRIELTFRAFPTAPTITAGPVVITPTPPTWPTTEYW